MRALQLLEQHHKRLAHILRFQHEHPSSTTESETSTAAPTPSTLNTSSGTPKISPSTQDAHQHPPKLSGNPRVPARDTSSIASNLASARGIPSHPHRSSPVSPTLSSQQAGAKMTEIPQKSKVGESTLRAPKTPGLKERQSRTSAPKQPWSPPNISPTQITSQQIIPPDSPEHARQRGKTPSTDEPFQRFYSTFEGLISKLSAPLAFAGLPLGSEGVQADSAHRKSAADTKLDRHHATPNRSSLSTEPDINKLYSRSALRALRDNNGGNGNTAESFYVVPTTGGTVSYAGILNRAEREARRTSFEEAEEDFVDARETPPSPELRHSVGGVKGSRLGRGNDKLTSLQNPKTMEELQMENQALKHLSDTLSKRLHMWEVNAQSSSMALQQSLKAMHHQHSAASPEHHPQHPSAVLTPMAPLSRTPSNVDHEQRIKDLEDKIQRSEADLKKVGYENEKLKTTLGRYRERWEKLKEGAKTRRAEAKTGNGDNNGAGPATAPKSPDALHTHEESPPLKAGGETESETPNEADTKPDLHES